MKATQNHARPERRTVAEQPPSDAVQRRPFWSGDEGSSQCDHLADGAEVCCDDESVKYEVEWKDGERSSSCEAHGVAVDRNLVAFIRTVQKAGEL